MSKLYLLLLTAMLVAKYATPVSGTIESKGDLLAFKSWDDGSFSGNLYIWDAQSGETVKLSDDISPGPLAQWSNDGRLAWRSLLGDIYVWDGNSILNIGGDAKQEEGLAWSCDGRLAWASDTHGSDDGTEGQIFVWNGHERINVSHEPIVAFGPAWSPDGRLSWNALRRPDGYVVYLWDGITTRRISNDPAWSPAIWSDDNRLAWETRGTATKPQSVQVWDGHTITTVSENVPGYSFAPAWSHDGRLAWIYQRNNSSTIVISDEQSLANIGGNPSTVDELAWSFDGRLAWSGDSLEENTASEGIYIWDGTNITTVSKTYGVEATWSQQGRLAWSSPSNGNWGVYVWDGEAAVRITPASDDYFAPVWNTLSLIC